MGRVWPRPGHRGRPLNFIVRVLVIATGMSPVQIVWIALLIGLPLALHVFSSTYIFGILAGGIIGALPFALGASADPIGAITLVPVTLIGGLVVGVATSLPVVLVRKLSRRESRAK